MEQQEAAGRIMRKTVSKDGDLEHSYQILQI